MLNRRVLPISQFPLPVAPLPPLSAWPSTARRTRRGSTPGHVQNPTGPPSRPHPRSMPPVSKKKPTAASRRCRKPLAQWHGAAAVRRGASQRVSPCLRAVQAETPKSCSTPPRLRAKNPAGIFSLEGFPDARLRQSCVILLRFGGRSARLEKSLGVCAAAGFIDGRRRVSV
jgi:hypothetical protein